MWMQPVDAKANACLGQHSRCLAAASQIDNQSLTGEDGGQHSSCSTALAGNRRQAGCRPCTICCLPALRMSNVEKHLQGDRVFNGQREIKERANYRHRRCRCRAETARRRCACMMKHNALQVFLGTPLSHHASDTGRWRGRQQPQRHKENVSNLDEPREDNSHAQQRKTTSNSWESESLAEQPRKDSGRETVRERESERQASSGLVGRERERERATPARRRPEQVLALETRPGGVNSVLSSKGFNSVSPTASSRRGEPIRPSETSARAGGAGVVLLPCGCVEEESVHRAPVSFSDTPTRPRN